MEKQPNPLPVRRRGRPPKRPSTNPVETILRDVRDVRARLVRREYVDEVRSDGTVKRRLKRIDAASANAVANLSRIELDAIAQWEAGEQVRRLREEVDRLREAMGELAIAS